MHVIAAKAVCFLEALKPEFKAYQRQIIANAKALENACRQNGIRMVSDGTDNHLILMDLTGTGRTGKEALYITKEPRSVFPRNSRKELSRTPVFAPV